MDRLLAKICAGALCVVATAMPFHAHAQETSHSVKDEQIAAVIVVGNEALSDAHYQAAIERYFGQSATGETLEGLLNDIAQRARDAGYAYASATLVPGASMRGIVQVEIDEGRIDEVRVEGYQNARAIAIIDGLRGQIAHRPSLESTLLHIADIPAVRLRSATFRREEGRGVLSFGLAKREGGYRIATDNYGTQSFGPWRARASLRHRDVLTSSDEVTAAVRINPVDLGELLYFSASYEAQVTSGGPTVRVAGSIGNTAPGGAFEGTELTGDTRRASLSVTQPILRTRDLSLWGEAQFQYLSIEQDVLDTILRSDTVVTASLGLRGQVNFDSGRLRGGVRYVRGLDLFDATREGTALASRSDGDAVFSKVEGWLDARLDLTGNVQAYVRARGQLANRPLLASQELGLGGAYTVRGYDFSEVLGDEGIYGLAELRFNVPDGTIPLDALQLYAFIDGGYVSDIGSDLGEGSLFSAGPGMRARLGPLDVELESAFPLGGSAERKTSNDPEINLRAGVNF